MLKIINDLRAFFEDNYRRISVREYSRITKVSAPTASKMLDGFCRKGLLKRQEERQYIYYSANRENRLFIELSRIYWRYVLEKSGLIDFLENELLNPAIILFGSLSKAEAKPDSDLDIAVFAPAQKKLDVKKFNKKLKREIQMFLFRDMNSVRNKELLKNMLNGYLIRGKL